PARVRGAEALLGAFGHVRRNQASHGLPEHPLSVAGFALIPMPLARLVFVYSYRCLVQPTQLVAGREAQSEVDQVVVEKRRPRLQGVSHAHLVLDEKDAGQKGLELEVQRGVDEVLVALKGEVYGRQHAGEHVERGVFLQVAIRVVVEKLRFVLVRDESLPEVVITLAEVLLTAAPSIAIVAPRVPPEELAPAGTRKDDLHELAGEAVGAGVRIATSH